MCATAVHPEERVEIFCVPASAARKIAETLGPGVVEYNARTGTLWMPALLGDISWEQYETLLEALPEHRLRHAYDQGTLEMMSPSTNHEWTKKFLGRLIETMAFELSIPMKAVGSATRKSKAAQKGLEPDESYYIANEPLMRERFDDAPGRDPPPDLVIEVDLRRAAVKRRRIYASLGVRELWEHDGKELRFYQLSGSGEYEPIAKSLSFPFLKPSDFTPYVDQRGKVSDNELIRGFIDQVRKKAKKPSAPRVKKKKRT